MKMIKKSNFVLLMIFSFLVIACPAPKYNHILINQSDEILEIEYEYILPAVKFDNSEIGEPAKTSISDYNDNNKDANSIWKPLIPEKDFQIESREESVKANNSENVQSDVKNQVKTVKLRLAPNEILRVFVSEHINFSIKNLKKISIKSSKGNLQIQGEGFEQFVQYRTGNFFTGKTDYRIIYK